ncbi:S1-C subfamily serine protease [Kineococcus radiotolerans]|uniref:S1-C subfamily serine protease n=1 Tax=Kineococcus radiotolerans TaxID=131568 RepID=A0A7W4TPZ8_KINRA|nr:trypsin-like peptidase domain-containing protein [Kineococcus radiotolerans]MBB2902978.1 S1-C subfamily serine protease [Kineococcus radiotolerans]
MVPAHRTHRGLEAHRPAGGHHRARRRGRAVSAGFLLAPLLLAGCTGQDPQDAAAPGIVGGAAATASASASASGAAGSAGSAGSAQSLQDAYQQVITGVLPSVVEIRTGSGLGSGVVLDEEGNIVTNAHVVGNATEFQVQFANSATSYPATLVGTYPTNDLAVIHVEGAPELHPATFGDSSAVEVGTIVLAMGNPLGLSSSVSNGIVSAVGRTVSEPAGESSPGATLPGTIQTSAAINPGNSGGALVDLDGEVIGIPTLAALSPSQDGAAPGIGFAIPSNTAKDIAGQLIANDGRVVDSNRAALEVSVTTLADASGQPAGVGVVAVDPGGAAAAAGVREGDVIVSVAGQDVTSTGQLSTVLAERSVGDVVDVVVVRDGRRETLQVTLGELASTS